MVVMRGVALGRGPILIGGGGGCNDLPEKSSQNSEHFCKSEKEWRAKYVKTLFYISNDELFGHA